MNIKTSDITGPVLDWAVAKAEGHDVAVAEGTGLILIRRGFVADYFDPSTNWGWGGPIIERECISITHERPDGSGWTAETDAGHDDQSEHGPTPLIAAMRCFVASKLGDEIDVPEELK